MRHLERLRRRLSLRTVGGRIAATFTVLSAITLVALAVTVAGLNTTRTSVREATGPAARAHDAAMAMRSSVAESLVGVAEYLRTGHPAQRAELAAAQERFARQASAYLALARSDRERALGRQAQSAFAELRLAQWRLLVLRDRRRAAYAAINGRYQAYEDVIDEAVVDNPAVPQDARARDVALGVQADMYELLADLGAHVQRDDGDARADVVENLGAIDGGLRELAGLRLPAAARASVSAVGARTARSARHARDVLAVESEITAVRRRSAGFAAGLTQLLQQRLMPLALRRNAAADGRATSASARTLLVTAGLAPLFLAVVLAGTIFLARSVTRPVRRLVAGMRAVEQGGLGRRIGPLGDDEIGALAGHFDRMVDQLARTTVSRDRLEASDAHLRVLTTELAFRADHDTVTGLANRSGFDRELTGAVARAAAGGDRGVLCYLDLDQFKLVNDTCGHGAGDELLRRVAIVLADAIGEHDVLARLGGDEFGLLLARPPEQARAAGEELRERLAAERFEWADRLFAISASIGVVPMTGAESPSDLLASADAACYAAKDNGRNRVQVYVPGDSELDARHGEMLWTPEILRALDEHRLVLHRQPIVPLSDTAERLPHHEVLVRLVDAHGVLIPPGAFIPAAERYGLMRRIDQWVLATTIAHLGVLHADATGPVEICAVNLSATSVSDPLLAREIEQLLDDHDVPGAALCFEITETSVIANLATARRLIEQLQVRGCRFALDDFGRGLSSFAHLRELPVDIVKIDGSFVRRLAEDPINEAIIRAVHDVARSIGAETVAECVEDEAILARVRALGIDYAQGYATGRPEPLALSAAPPATRRPISPRRPPAASGLPASSGS